MSCFLTEIEVTRGTSAEIQEAFGMNRGAIPRIRNSRTTTAMYLYAFMKVTYTVI
jgi:hypothetical protein